MEQGGVYEMTIGALAGAVGVTARAIRHYESVGLLEPAERSVGGHRRYTRDDLDRLGRITALRRAGFGWRRSDACWPPPRATKPWRWRSAGSNARRSTWRLRAVWTRV